MARDAYLVAPRGPDGPVGGPGVLLLHSWWGLTAGFRRMADRLADEGFVVLAPDLSDGLQPTSQEEARAALAGADADAVADLVVSSAATLRSLTLTPDGPVGVVGFSMGGSWGLWLTSRQPHLVAAAVSYYGAQEIGYEDAEARVLIHAAEHDELVSDDEMVLLESALALDGCDAEVHRYPGTGHWFAEADRPGAFDAGAAEAAWDRTVAFLRATLPAHPRVIEPGASEPDDDPRSEA